MGLTNGTLLKKAMKNGYAVGAFNFTSLEQLDVLIDVANELNFPIIIQTSKKAIDYMGIKVISALVAEKTKHIKAEVCLNLDHGNSLEICKTAIDSGYTNVMIDASDKALEENIKITKSVVKYAHAHNVTVEAELGSLKGIEDDVVAIKSHFTDPKTAKYFVEQTGIDSLAISIGTSHGAYKFKGESVLDIERLKEIKKIVKIPLVLHGASSVPQKLIEKLKMCGGDLTGAKGVDESQLKLAIENGICKVNIDTDLRIAFTVGLRQSLLNPKVFDLREYLTAGKQEMNSLVKQKILFLRNNKL